MRRAALRPIWPKPSISTATSSARCCATCSHWRARCCRAQLKKPRCSDSTAHSAVSAMAAFIAGSTIRASGTWAGNVASASSRSTPAHSDWIRRKRGSRARLPGAGLATTAASMDASSTSPRCSSSRCRGASAARSACAQASRSTSGQLPHSRMFMPGPAWRIRAGRVALACLSARVVHARPGLANSSRPSRARCTVALRTAARSPE